MTSPMTRSPRKNRGDDLADDKELLDLESDADDEA